MSGIQGAAPLPGGTTVEGFVIDRVVEQGRYSVSYLAREATRVVLLREFLPQAYLLREGTQVQAREAEDRNALRWWMRGFVDQAQTLIKLRHPALPTVHRVFEANGTAYGVSDPVAGETLEALLQREGTIDEARLRRLLQPLLDGLDGVHRAGLLHRDIRPQNVMVRGDGSAVLVDFAVLRSPVRLKSGLLSGAGLAPYAAPEELFASGSYGAWTDLYALGALAYRAICGIEPPSSEQRRDGAALIPAAQAARVRASDALLQAIDWALMPVPTSRPPSVSAWRAALQADYAAAAAPTPGARVERSGGLGLKLILPVLLIALAGAGYWLFDRAASTSAAPAVVAGPPLADAPPPSTSAEAPVSPAAAPAGAEQKPSSLDQLALDLMSKDRKAQDAARDQKTQDQHDKDERDRKARESTDKATRTAEPEPASEKPAAKPADKPSKSSSASAAADDTAVSARTRQLEEEIARLKAEKEQQSQDSESSRAAREKSAQDAELAAQADRERQAQTIARARKNCRIPAPSLSSAGNLTFETAIRVPGAERTGGGAVRLPPLTTSDGETRQFEITADSCARLVN